MVAFLGWPFPKGKPLLRPIMTSWANRCLEDITLLMRKTVSRFSGIISFHKRLILAFNIQNGWNEVIFQLIHLMGLRRYRLMDCFPALQSHHSRNRSANPCLWKVLGRHYIYLSGATGAASPNKGNRAELHPKWWLDVWTAASPALVFSSSS